MTTPERPAATDSKGVAVVGLSCRLPGAATPDAFWELLATGASAVTETPAARWDANALYADLSRPGRATRAGGGHLDEVDRFDVASSGISPREVVDVDPQQRLAPEPAWEALEHTGVVPAAVREHAVGVFMGASAAVVSGKLGLDDAATVVTLRSRIIAAELARQGARSGHRRVARPRCRRPSSTTGRGRAWRTSSRATAG
ncbi:beta-ketoacyl synthase N-terminal-like domain-containing protein [Lentzea albida]|uniref:Beta-ketoacyl synthase, N-terminal domain n=1 Tax=Lentzea albida TaxID=65499 RepID=A0A1H9MFE1_9PSEU|nr:beta-ketoacyl synthase N-terminal-like domain-containing protein [Lentzea albida]SER22426.1 Beta-ketoacyl synthase, N-terminal domain [Lentzea albida]